VLTISPAASEAIRDLVAASELPDNAGIRITNRPGVPGTFELLLAPEAGEADEVVEERGATVFLDDEAAELLNDKTLDAQIHGEQVAFTLVGRSGDEDGGGVRS
jgi:iron-sulfur cluster assembly protein